MVGLVKHGSDAGIRGLVRRPTPRPPLRAHWKIRPVEAVQDPAVIETGLETDVEDRNATGVSLMQIDNVDDPVAGENEVCLHRSTNPVTSQTTDTNTANGCIKQQAKNTFTRNITPSVARATIAPMPIRSRHPERRYLEVGQRVEAVRLFAGLTTIEMAALMGIGQARYVLIHYGRVLPDAEKLEPLCERWGVSLDWLYRGDPKMMPVGVWDGIKAQLQTLVDEHGQPIKRKSGRPVGPGRKTAKTES